MDIPNFYISQFSKPTFQYGLGETIQQQFSVLRSWYLNDNIHQSWNNLLCHIHSNKGSPLTYQLVIIMYINIQHK